MAIDHWSLRKAESPSRQGHARVDTQRAVRCGFPEVIFGAGKAPDELTSIAQAVLDHHDRLLVTRVTDAGAAALRGWGRGSEGGAHGVDRVV